MRILSNYYSKKRKEFFNVKNLKKYKSKLVWGTHEANTRTAHWAAFCEQGLSKKLNFNS